MEFWVCIEMHCTIIFNAYKRSKYRMHRVLELELEQTNNIYCVYWLNCGHSSHQKRTDKLSKKAGKFLLTTIYS